MPAVDLSGGREVGSKPQYGEQASGEGDDAACGPHAV